MASDQDLESRMPPNDREAERALLGLCLRDNSNLAMAMGKVRGASFYQFAHRTIFEAIVELVIVRNTPADPVSLADLLNEEESIQDCGGYGYIVELWDAAPSTNAEGYADIIRGCAIKRAVAIIADEIRAEAFAPGSDWSAVVDMAEKKLYGLSSKVRAAGTAKLSVKVQESIDRMGRRSEGREGGVLTGWKTLDAVTGGFEAGDLVVVAARPSVGKTAFSVAMVAEMASLGVPGFICSIEQPGIELADRLIAANALVDLHHIRTGQVHDKEEDIFNAADAIKQLPIDVCDESDIGIIDIIALMRRQASQGAKVFMIDYLQLITPDDTKVHREQQVAQMTRRLKIAARTTGLVLILLAQLNRESKKRADPRPRVEDLRESGAIEQDADVILMLHKSDDEVNQLEVLCEKNRKGTTGSVLMVYEKRFARFQEWAV